MKTDAVVDELEATPRWWIILWSAWGLIVAGIILWLDQQPWSAAPWMLGGIIIGLFGPRVLHPLEQPIFDWYHQLNPDLERIEEKECLLLIAGKSESREFEQCLEEEAFWTCFMIPPFFGMFHGVLVGAIFGALYPLEDNSHFSSAMSAAIGLFLGPVLIAFIASITIACIIRPVPGITTGKRFARRAMLAVSPLLALPCAWHCLQALSHRRWTA